ncbi:MAG: complex I subunit 5 family protein [Elusimicrobiales bacterium]
MTISYFSFVSIPALAALACPFVAKLKPRYADMISGSALLAGLITAVSYIWEFHQPVMAALPPADLTFNLEVFRSDIFSLLMIIAIYLVAAAVAFFSIFHRRQDSRAGIWQGLLLMSAAAMSGIVSARDFFTLYVFVEVAAVAAYALIAFDDTAEGIEGALKYFFMSAPASAFILLGVALLMLYTGGVSFAHLSRAASASAANETAVVVILGVMACGFMVKAGLVPFHGWTPDAYQSAPAPVSALLSGIVTKAAGVYALVRIAMALKSMPGNVAAAAACNGLMFFGGLSIVVGALGALRQRDFKRMLAFSSISQVGYIVLAAGAGTPLAMAGAIFHLFNHTTFKASLFLNSAAIEKQTGTTDMKSLSGLETRMPWTALTSSIAMLSTAGIPPLSGFWSKAIIIFALWKAGFHGYAVIATLASVLTLAYFIVMQSRVFFGKTPEHLLQVREAEFGMLVPVIVFSAIIVALGLYFPILFTGMAWPAARTVL